MFVRGSARANVAVEKGPPPAAFALLQNQPNPFGRSTTIRYALPRACDVSLEVFDVRGQRVATLARGWQESGWYTVAFGGDARGRTPGGVYFYRLRAAGYTSTRKMLFVR